jgi:hypothetical protein
MYGIGLGACADSCGDMRLVFLALFFVVWCIMGKDLCASSVASS